MAHGIQRRFVRITGRFGARQVHYRAGGRGPVLLLLHQSPQSSRELEPLMASWGADFTVLAPDTPGYGLSDPLGLPKASLDDFAAALMEFADALGVGRFGVYGFHTGGMIGLALADRYPERVRAAACNGVMVSAPGEVAGLLDQYLPPLVPRWDGAHLAWLWARNREQNIFFPWHRPSLATRMDFPMSPPDRQQTGVLEFLRAADHYQVAYRGAFLYRADETVRRLKVPTLITAARRDPLSAHLGRLGVPASAASVMESADTEEALARCLAHLRAHAGDESGASSPTGSADADWTCQVLDTPQGRLLVRRHGAADGVPILLLHGAGASSLLLEPLAVSLARFRPVLVLDLPGHGESDPAPDSGPLNVAQGVAAVRSVLRLLEVPAVDLIGWEAGGLVGLELLATDPALVRRLLLLEPPAPDGELRQAFLDQGLPSMAPDWHGGHLSRCWHMVRDGRLYFPWFCREPRAIRWREPDVDPAELHREVVEYLKAEGAWQSLLRDALYYPLSARLATASPEVLLAAVEGGAWRESVTRLAEATGRQLHLLPEAPAAQAEALQALLAAAPD